MPREQRMLPSPAEARTLEAPTPAPKAAVSSAERFSPWERPEAATRGAVDADMQDVELDRKSQRGE